MGASISQRIAPTQRAGFFYAASAPIPSTFANKHTVFVLGRGNPFGNPGQVAAAQAGAIEMIYFDVPLYYKGGTYDNLFLNANTYGPAIGSMGGGSGYGPATDILSNTTAVVNKMAGVIRRIRSDFPLAKGIFMDDSGPDWVGYPPFSAGTRESIYLAWVVIAARYRALADELGLLLICNGEWRGGAANPATNNQNHGYPSRTTYGCSYIDGFCIEGPAGHGFDQIGFWRTVMAGQWRLRDSAGRRANLYISPNSTQTGLWSGEVDLAWIAQQVLYDTNPSHAAAVLTPHDLGLAFTGATPTITVTVTPTSATVQTGATQQFTGSASNGAALTWKVAGVTGGNSTVGTVTTGGLYTAPAAVPPTPTVSVTASVSTGQSASSPVTIQATAPAPPPTGGTPPTAPAPNPSADGNRFVGTTPNSGMGADYNRGVSVFWNVAGTITDVVALVDGLATGGAGTQPIRYAIYSDTAGSPGTLLAVTADGTITAGENPYWKTLSLVAPLVVSAATQLHLNIHSGTNIVGRYWYTNNPGVSAGIDDVFVGGSLATFGTPTAGNADISIYANFTLPGTGETWPDGTTADIRANLFEARIYATSGKRLTGSNTWDPASTADGAMTSTTVTVTGATVGMPADVGFSVAVPAGAILSGNVTAADTVTVTLFNKTGGVLDLASGTLRADVRTV